MENKYYKADVQIVSVQDRNISSSIIEFGEAILIYCDFSKTGVLGTLDALMDMFRSFEVKLLVCDSCASEDSEVGLSRSKAQQWCIGNRWELVELSQHETDESDDFPESWGFKRILEALHAHTWSNLRMKDNQGSRLNTLLQSIASVEESSIGSMHETDEIMYTRLAEMAIGDESHCATSRLDDNEQSCRVGESMDQTLEDRLCCGYEDDFESLFSTFEHLKRTAASLPPEQRRDHAEKVAVAFWRAMGGGDDEVADSDSD